MGVTEAAWAVMTVAAPTVAALAVDARVVVGLAEAVREAGTSAVVAHAAGTVGGAWAVASAAAVAVAANV